MMQNTLWSEAAGGLSPPSKVACGCVCCRACLCARGSRVAGAVQVGTVLFPAPRLGFQHQSESFERHWCPRSLTRHHSCSGYSRLLPLIL